MQSAQKAPYGIVELQSLILPSAGVQPTSTSQPDMEAALWRRFLAFHDKEAREALIMLHLPYARAVAAGLYGSHSYHETEFKEYVQLATLGLIECVDRYNPSHSVKFRTYAYLRIRGAVGDGLSHISERQEQLSLHRRLGAERLRAAKTASATQLNNANEVQLLKAMADISVSLMLGMMLEDTGMLLQPDSVLPDRCYESVALNELKARVHDSLRHLTPREHSVIRCHYLQGMTYELVADALGITRGRVAQLHEQALRKLRTLVVPKLS